MFLQFRLRRLAVAGHDECVADFSVYAVRHRDHRGERYGRMALEGLLDLARVNVVAAGLEDLLEPAAQSDETIGAANADISGSHPAFCVEHLSRCLRASPVAAHEEV